MHKLLKLSSSIIYLVATLSAATEEMTPAQLNELWLTGQKQEVLAIGEKRLEKDHNDLAGLLIKWDYALSFSQLKEIKAIAPRLREASMAVNTPQFLKVRPMLLSDLEHIPNLRSNFPPEVAEAMALAEAHKGLIPGKPMNTRVFFKALEVDGYFNKSQEVPATPSSPTKTEQLRPKVIKPIWWIIGAIAALAAVVFVARRKKPKA